MLRLVEPQNRIQWETFQIQDQFAAQFRVNTGIAIVSERMTNVMLGQLKWRGTRYLNDVGEYAIGYGVGDPDNQQGYTEPQAYAEWIGFVRNRQKVLRAQLPIFALPQSVYDALVSLFVDTGTWRTVESDEGTYDMADAVRNSNWLLVADILSRGRANPNLRRIESSVAYLGAYPASKDRNQQIVQGLQDIRKAYTRGINSAFDKTQAEFVYYRQLGSFLPGMSQLRQRRIISQVKP